MTWQAYSAGPYTEARDDAMARGGRAVYAAVGYVTGEAMCAAKAVMVTADQAVPVELTPAQARTKRFEKPDRDAWKSESLSVGWCNFQPVLNAVLKPVLNAPGRST